MKIYEWKEGMTSEESKDIGYWERNILALYIATNHNDLRLGFGMPTTCGWYYDTDNNWDGWKRVISIHKGKITFHIPDDFDIGSLPQIEPDWDGHSTHDKWDKIMRYCGCRMDE